MQLECDVVLLGTGLAPLVAANQFISQGKSVVILNPDWDFFSENSELPLDPLWRGSSSKSESKVTSKRLRRSLSEPFLEELRPDYPGVLEYCVLTGDAGTTVDPKGYHDRHAPTVRARDRLWVRTDARPHDRSSDFLLSQIYVESDDAGLKPVELDGVLATSRFPGFSDRETHNHWGILLPRLCEVDVDRYRTGILEYIRHKISPDNLRCGVTQIEAKSNELHFYDQGKFESIKIKEEIIVFWTPRISPWIERSFVAHIPASERQRLIEEYSPIGLRVWDEWVLLSKKGLNPNTIAHYGNVIAWADLEGKPSDADLGVLDRLRVMRCGPLVDPGFLNHPETGKGGLSLESFQSIADLTQGFLKWDRFSIRSMQVRYIFEWRGKKSAPNVSKFWSHEISGVKTRVIHGCDGPLTEVVHRARQAAGVGL